MGRYMGIVRVSGPPLLAAAGIYISTLAPTVLGMDSAELVTGAYSLGIVHPTGYPLYLILGKLFTYIPIGSIAYRVNLLSAVMGILTIGMLAAIVYRLTYSLLASWAGALFLAVANTFWSMATVAEVYTLHTLILAVVIYVALDYKEHGGPKKPYLVAFLAGLGLTNHVTTALALPFILWIMAQRLGLRRMARYVPGCVVALSIGLLPYLYLPIRFAADPPLNYVRTYYGVDLATAGGVLWMITGQAYRFFAFGYDLHGYVQQLSRALALFYSNFGALGIVLMLLGAAVLYHRKRDIAGPLGGILLANVTFFSGYAVVDKDTMFLPALLILAIGIGIGVHFLLQLVARSSALLLGEKKLIQSAIFLGLIAGIGILASGRWTWMDRNQSYGPQLLAKRVFETVPPDSVVIGKWSTAVVLEYYQVVEGQRPDLVILNRSRYEVATYYNNWRQGLPHADAMHKTMQAESELIRILGQERDVYDLEYDPGLARDYEYRPMGFAFQLKPRVPPQG